MQVDYKVRGGALLYIAAGQAISTGPSIIYSSKCSASNNLTEHAKCNDACFNDLARRTRNAKAIILINNRGEMVRVAIFI